MASFNLTDNAWIPVIMKNNYRKKLSLTELFEKAHEIREIYCDYPLETISLNRFLQALLFRIYEVNHEEKWWDLWNKGKFEISTAKSYLAKWYSRFDIFDKDRPFYQSIQTLSKGITPFSKLRLEDSSANNATLFDHTYDNRDYIIEIWRIPIILITAQSYSVGGGISNPFNFSGATLIGGCSFWIKENSLFNSLLLNTDFTGIVDKMSLCEWEKNNCIECISRVPEDYLDYLTWQSRSIVFKYKNPDSFDNNGKMVFGENKAQLYFHQGDRLEGDYNDPLMAKRIGKDRVLSIRFELEKSLWRHAEVLFQHKTESGARASNNIYFIADKLFDLGYDTNSFFEVEAYGLLNDQAKVLLRKKETLPYFPAIINTPKESSISEFLDNAEKQSKNLYYALETLCRFILYPSKDENVNMSKDERDDVKRFIKSINVEKNYWVVMEKVFFNFLQKVAITQFQTSEEYQTFMNEFSKEIFVVAKQAFYNSTLNFNTNAKQLRAITLSINKLYPVNLKGRNNDN